MQGNAPCHTAKHAKNYFEEDVQVMKWPAQISDLNPIKNLWYIIGENVCKEQLSTVTDSWDKIEQEPKKITPKLCQALVRSCCRRCAEVIKNEGFKTSYYVFYGLFLPNLLIFLTYLLVCMVVLLFFTSKMCCCYVFKFNFYSINLFHMKFWHDTYLYVPR